MGLIDGVYDAKAEGFVPGGASLHNCMSGHGPDAANYRARQRCRHQPARSRSTDTMAFMFETRCVIRPDALRARDARCCRATIPSAGRGCRKRFDPAATLSRCDERSTKRTIPNCTAGSLPPTSPARTFRCRTCRSACSAAPAAASRFAAASPSAIRFSTSRRQRRSIGRAGAGAAAAAAAAAAQPALNELMVAGPAGLVGSAAGAVARAATGFATAGGCSRACCPGAGAILRCRRTSAITPTSTPRSTTPPTSAAVPARQSAAAQLQVGADRLSRPRLVDWRLRHAVSAAVGPGPAAGRAGAPHLRRQPAAGLRAGARRVHRRRQRARRAHSASQQAERHVFGLCLLNDWSARDLQAWEYQPLGPFLAKNFATTISPWIVTLEALEPFRVAWTRPAADPQPLAYLDSSAAARCAAPSTSTGGAAADRGHAPRRDRLHGVCRAAASATPTGPSRRWWRITPSTVATCGRATCSAPARSPGRSPPRPDRCWSCRSAANGALTLPDGETRRFLQDGDAVIMRGWCEREGAARIGFGEVVGRVLKHAP